MATRHLDGTNPFYPQGNAQPIDSSQCFIGGICLG